MLKSLIIVIILGLIIGSLYFFLFERPNQNSVSMECWQKLHYLNKEYSPLILVHLKSIIAGIIIILCAIYGYTSIIILFGAAIIGLHISQWYIEKKYININGKKSL
jgi:uncharacterized integral membrane protein